MTDPMTVDRKGWMALLAKAGPPRLAALLPDLAPHALLRGPEIGTVMVQGMTGATGAAFNLGEMTVTRCSIRLDCGTVGHAWVQGRDAGHARRAAVADALLQTDAGQHLRHADNENGGRCKKHNSGQGQNIRDDLMVEVNEGNHDQNRRENEKNQEIQGGAEFNKKQKRKNSADQFNQWIAPGYFPSTVAALCAQQ